MRQPTAGSTMTVPYVCAPTCILAAVCLPVPGVEAVAGLGGSAQTSVAASQHQSAASSTVVLVANCPCVCAK
jgi:hypothetical protein